jgi:hypothetical protein
LKCSIKTLPKVIGLQCKSTERNRGHRLRSAVAHSQQRNRVTKDTADFRTASRPLQCSRQKLRALARPCRRGFADPVRHVPHVSRRPISHMGRSNRGRDDLTIVVRCPFCCDVQPRLGSLDASSTPAEIQVTPQVWTSLHGQTWPSSGLAIAPTCPHLR